MRVNRVRDDLLASAAFAGDEHFRVRSRDPFDFLPECDDVGALADELYGGSADCGAHDFSAANKSFDDTTLFGCDVDKAGADREVRVIRRFDDAANFHLGGQWIARDGNGKPPSHPDGCGPRGSQQYSANADIDDSHRLTGSDSDSRIGFKFTPHVAPTLSAWRLCGSQRVPRGFLAPTGR